MDWKMQCCKDISSMHSRPKSKLFFYQKFTVNPKIHMEIQKGKNSKGILKEEEMWKT